MGGSGAIKYHSDKNIRDALRKTAKIRDLEELLEVEQAELRRLQLGAADDEFPLGIPVHDRELPGLLSEVKGVVDDMLDTHDVSQPNVRFYDPPKERLGKRRRRVLYTIASLCTAATAVTGVLSYNGDTSWVGPAATLVPAAFSIGVLARDGRSRFLHYEVGRKRINCLRGFRSSVVDILAHEYVHHVQAELHGKKYPKKCRLMSEGVAIGVSAAVARYYAQREQDDRYLYHVHHGRSHELGVVYKELCAERGIVHDPNLLRFQGNIDDYTFSLWGISLPGVHAEGGTFCYLWEQDEGVEIYKEIMHNRFSFD